MKKQLIFIYFVIFISSLFAQHVTIKEFRPAGRVDALVNYQTSDNWLLVQLDLKNDSLFNIVNNILPEMELFSGPASYHRIIQFSHLDKIQAVLTSDFLSIIDRNYNVLSHSREFWIEVKQGSETHETFSEDDAIEYTCSCLSGASDCVKLGWDDGWYNPFDYWGEAWYAYTPPYYQSIEEIRVVVRGGQCDDLPLWSETYMGMMDDNGNWSQDYELSINYTDNEYIVTDTWNGSDLMPRIGSEDNYCIDTIRLKFYYTCDEPDSPTNIIATNGEDCFTVNLAWSLPSNTINSQILYRDGIAIAQFDANENIYEDWGAQAGLMHTYCIEAYNECGSSSMECAVGSLASVPNAPQNVNASDGNYPNIVFISWDSSDNTEQYKIYRDESWMGFVDANTLDYTDLIPEMNAVYDYCIEAINTCGESSWNCDSGYIAEPLGDVNNDGAIDILDVVFVINIVLDLHTPNKYELEVSDLNYDGIIDILDIILIVNSVLNN